MPGKNYSIILRCLMSLFLLLATALLGVLLMSRFHYEKGIALFNNGLYADALVCLAHAEDTLDNLPRELRFRDWFRIWSARGKVYFKLGAGSKDRTESYALLKKGAGALSLAVAYDPLNYQSMFWAARTEAALEQLWPAVMGQDIPNPHNALPLYQKATAFRPGGMTLHYELARYLFRKGEMEKIPQLVRKICRVYPLASNDLINEPFYSRFVRDAIKKGLKDAVQNHTFPGHALPLLSRMEEKDGNYKLAALYQEKTLEHKKHMTTSDDYLQMCRLYLKQDNLKNANEAAIKAASISDNFEAVLESLLRTYRYAQQLPQYLRFLEKLEQMVYSSKYIDLAKAACKLELGALGEAKLLLIRLNQTNPEAKAYGMLARIAEIEKDWDAMELNSQQATHMKPEIYRYWILFSKSLRHNQKMSQAEDALSQAILAGTEREDLLLYYRAEIRFLQKKYKNAMSDLLQADKIRPGDHRIYYLMAKTYQGLGDKRKAIFYIQKALGLAPDQNHYRRFNLKLGGGH